jgi:Putative  PD-(D/E)XK family member, (DUF4420)
VKGSGSSPAAILSAFTELAGSRRAATGDSPDYVLGARIGSSFVGLARNGDPSLVIPLGYVPTGVTRATGGCLLRPSASVEFEYKGRRWAQPAATLECTIPNLVDAFAVLASDVADRLTATGDSPEWCVLADIVQEWQSLLASLRGLSPERELGLWGELWFILRSHDPGLLLRAWTGPGGGVADFVNDGMSIEVKTSTTRLSHWISHAQVNRPLGDLPAFILSLWVAGDPTSGKTLATLANDILTRIDDRAEALRRLLMAGYSPADHLQYIRPFVILEEPHWFDVSAVPKVQLADEGVLRLRYLAELDEARALRGPDVERLSSAFAQPRSMQPCA